MMERLRTAANSTILKIVFAVIILSFLLTGVGGYLVGGSKDYAVKVNGQKIPIANFERAVENERLRQQQQYGEQFAQLMGNETYLKQVRNQVMVNMVDGLLLDQYADKLGLAASDQMIEQSIFTTPEFQTNGKFDNEKYRAILSRMGLSPEGYANSLRQQLINQQLVQGFSLTEFTLPQELHSLAEISLQSREVRLAKIDAEKLMPAQQVSDKEQQDYYQSHSKSFMLPEQVKINYIELDADKLTPQSAAPSKSEIDSYYQQHKENFTKLAQYRYSIIQLKSEKEAASVLAELKKGADFAKLAKNKSEDVISKKKGGDIGWMEQAALPVELVKAGLTQKGQLSTVIPYLQGYLVARLEDMRPEQIQPQSEVQKEIVAALQKDKTVAAFYAAQQKLADGAANDNESLATAEAAVGIKVETSNWFDRQTVPAVLNSPQLVQAIFSGNLFDGKGNALGNSDLINIDDKRSFVLRIAGYKPEQLKTFSAVKGEIATLLKRQKAQSQAREESEKILAALTKGKEQGEAALKAANITFADKQTLTRDGEDRMLAEKVFALPHPQQGKPIYGIAQDNQDNVVVIELVAVNPGKLKADKEKSFADEQLKGNTDSLFDALLTSLRQKADIKINPEIEKQ